MSREHIAISANWIRENWRGDGERAIRTSHDESLVNEQRRTMSAAHHTCYRLATALLTLALLTALPAVTDLVEHFRAIQSPGIAGWAGASLLGALLLAGLAAYMVQLPDRSALRLVAVVLLLVSMSYAALLGLTLFASPDARLIRWLELSEAQYHGTVRWYCFVMASAASGLTFLIGRASFR